MKFSGNFMQIRAIFTKQNPHIYTDKNFNPRWENLVLLRAMKTNIARF